MMVKFILGAGLAISMFASAQAQQIQKWPRGAVAFIGTDSARTVISPSPLSGSEQIRFSFEHNYLFDPNRGWSPTGQPFVFAELGSNSNVSVARLLTEADLAAVQAMAEQVKMLREEVLSYRQRAEKNEVIMRELNHNMLAAIESLPVSMAKDESAYRLLLERMSRDLRAVFLVKSND